MADGAAWPERASGRERAVRRAPFAVVLAGTFAAAAWIAFLAARPPSTAAEGGVVQPVLRIVSAGSTPALPLLAFFLPLGHTPVPVDVSGLRMVGEVARAAAAELALAAKLGHAVTAADVRVFVISRDEAQRLVADASRSVPAAEKGASLGALDAFNAAELRAGSCLLLELGEELGEKHSLIPESRAPASKISVRPGARIQSSSAEPQPLLTPTAVPSFSQTPISPDQERVFAILSNADFADYSAFADYYKVQLQREPPQGLKSWFNYAREQRCSLSQVYYSRIERDLARFRPAGILPEDLEVARSLPHLWSFTFEAGKVQGATEYLMLFEPIAFLVPNMTISVNALDEPRVPFHNAHNLSGPFSLHCGEDTRDIMKGSCGADFWRRENSSHGFFTSTITFNVFIPRDRPIPIFSQSKIDECFMDITIPSHYFLRNAYKADQDWKHWNEKKKTDLFWRGSGSGACASSNRNWRRAPRFRLIGNARQNTDWDVKMTHVGPCEKAGCDEEYAEYVTPDAAVSFNSHFEYKYLLDVDGNSFSQRLPPLLRSNSLILRESVFAMYFDDFIKDDEHYVKVNADNLLLKYREMKQPGSRAEAIAFEAFRTATRYLRIEDMRCYMARLLIEFGALLKTA